MKSPRPKRRPSKPKARHRDRKVRVDVLRQIMDEHDWDNHDLAAVTGLSLHTIERILVEGRYIRRGTAKVLEESLSKYTTLPLFENRFGIAASQEEKPVPAPSSRLEALYRACDLLRPELRQYIRTREFASLIQKRTVGFVGRQWLFDALDRFLSEQSHGYFVVRGMPGVGKTAFAAELTRRRGCVHHFNSRFTGLNRVEPFVANVCGQLIAAYGIVPEVLPVTALRDSGILVQHLTRAAARHPNEKILLVIDALDEAEPQRGFGENPLALPRDLPERSYILLTLRDVDVEPRFECPVQPLFLEQMSDGNLRDIRFFLEGQAARKGLQAYCARQGLAKDDFIRLLEEKSQGNFMYLHYVLPAIEHGRLAYCDSRQLPEGLTNYYESHWQLMRDQDRAAWHGYKLPILVVLSTATEPVSLRLLADRFRKVPPAVIREVLQRDWRQFLEREQAPLDGTVVTRWKLYHASFADFLRSKAADPDEQIDLEGERAAWFQYGQEHGITPD